MICTCCFDRKYPDGITSDQARKADERENETDSENSIWDRELLDGITEIWHGEPIQGEINYIYSSDGRIIGGTF